MISIIIPVYNNNNGLCHCLDSILDNSYKDYEILVIDNGSEPAINIDNYKYNSRIRLLQERIPGSYAARNKGITNAAGEILGFTDSDCIVESDWIENAIAIFQSRPDTGFIGGKIRMFCPHDKARNPVEKYELNFSMNQEKYVRHANFAATANMWTRMNVIENVGIFNPLLMSSGDKEWGNRVINAGYSSIYSVDVVVKHPVRSNILDFRNKNLRIGSGFYASSSNKKEIFINIYKILMIGKHRTKDLLYEESLSTRDKINILFTILLERIYIIYGFMRHAFTNKQYR